VDYFEVLFWCPSGGAIRKHEIHEMGMSVTDRYCALIGTALFDTQAPTCFGIHVPSSGNFVCPYELFGGRNGYVVCHVL
jgi:hypothetical protein